MFDLDVVMAAHQSGRAIVSPHTEVHRLAAPIGKRLDGEFHLVNEPAVTAGHLVKALAWFDPLASAWLVVGGHRSRLCDG